MTGQKENNTVLFVALGVAAVLLVMAIVGMKFFTNTPPPPLPPAPPAPPPIPMSQSPLMYKGQIEEDAKRYGVPAPTVQDIARPLAYTEEVDAPHVLKPGDSFETAHLRIGTHVIKEWAKSESGQGFRYEHLVLSITNKATGPLAYRVQTQISAGERCSSKAQIGHNAIALGAGEKIERTECLWRKGMTLTVVAADTLELPALGYYYVSRLLPLQLGLDKRGADGHAAPSNVKACGFVPWREIEVSGGTWPDVMDFYARHNCDEYTIPRGYKRRTAIGPLPALDPSKTVAPLEPSRAGAPP